MIRLFVSELMRARSRRLVWLLVVGSAAGVAVGVAIATVRSSPPTPAEVAVARRAEARDRQTCLNGGFGPTEDQPPEGYRSLAEFCDEAVQLSNYLHSDVIHRAALPDLLRGASLIVVLLAVVIAASLGGADWSAGSMATLLTWESRRARVVATRAFVVAISAVTITLFAQVVLAIAWIVGTALEGITTVPEGFVGHTVGSIVRITAVGALFGLVAFAIATIGRSTTAAIGILLGYLVVVEGFLAGIWSGLLPWLLVRAANVVISGVPLVDPFAAATYGPDGRLIEAGGHGVLLSVAGGWTLIAGYAVMLLGLAVALTRARDVT